MPVKGSVVSLAESTRVPGQSDRLSSQRKTRFRAPKIDLWPPYTGAHMCPYHIHTCTDKQSHTYLYYISK